MKGVIFNELESFITEGWGAETYEAIMARCPLHTRDPFIGPGTYPDADLLAIVAKTTEKLGIGVPEALHAFGKFLFPRLAARVPKFLECHAHPKTFLMSIDSFIHVEVNKLFKGAVTPKITCEEDGESFTIHYQSARKVCPLFTGLLAGAGAHFGVPITWVEKGCMSHGEESCRFDLEFQ